jgi:raffinose/stachyose/melibiose transport system permease protein
MRSPYRVLKPWLFLFPAAAIYLTVVLGPSLYTLVLSLFKWNGAATSAMTFVGWDNYIKLFANDTVFRLALTNTLLWTVCSVVLLTSIALGLAVVLNQPLKGRSFFRSIFYFPTILSAIVVAFTWRWMYHPQGVINGFLSLIGLGDAAPAWLAEPSTALWSVFLTSLWFGLGQPLVLFLAGLQTIPQEPYEAAVIDGASSWQQFVKITIPMLRETITIVLATTFIGAMRVYDLIFAMTGGGPAESTQVLSSWMYYQTFQFTNVGVGSAISWILVGICMFVIIPYIRFSTRKADE